MHDNIEVDYMHMRLMVNGILKEFIKTRDSWPTEPELLYMDEQKYDAIKQVKIFYFITGLVAFSISSNSLCR
jgi:hypothetical protein